MDELIQRASEHLGYPPGMVERSARARAQAEGTTPEAILAGWLGEEAPAGGAPPAPATPAAAPSAGGDDAAPAAPAAPTGPSVEVLAPAAAAPSAAPAPPAEPDPEPEEDDEDEEASRFAVPSWLAAAFVVLPLIAVVYALFLPNGPGCGSGAVLAIDPETGRQVNCDGSEYGSASADFVSLGAEMYGTCGACHGANGAGAGSFPAFTGGTLLTTFPPEQCDQHVLWIELATAGWPDPTYGANNKAVGGSGAQMPGFLGQPGWDELTIRAVALYERVAFGGQPVEEAEVDCGLVTPDGEPVEMSAAGP